MKQLNRKGYSSRDSPVVTKAYCGDILYKIPSRGNGVIKLRRITMSKEETIKFRVSAEEKAACEDKAKRAGLSLSSLIRAVLQTPGKIIFIEEGAEIAKGFGSCQRLLAHYMATGRMTDGELMELRQSMDNITNLLYTVTKNLSSIDIEMDDDDLEEM